MHSLTLLAARIPGGLELLMGEGFRPLAGRDDRMPRLRKPYRHETHVFPEDFPQRLEQLKEASGLTWSELARRLGTNPLTLRRWRQSARPNALHLLALLQFAAALGLAHLLALPNVQPRNEESLWGPLTERSHRVRPRPLGKSCPPRVVSRSRPLLAPGVGSFDPYSRSPTSECRGLCDVAPFHCTGDLHRMGPRRRLP